MPKCEKLRGVVPNFAIYKDVMVILSEGCSYFGESRFRVFDLAVQSLWYFIKSKGLSDFLKVILRVKSLTLKTCKEVL